VNDEDLRSLMIMLRIDTVRRLSSTSDVKTVGLGNVDELIRVLGHSGSDDREILFGFGARISRVNEGIQAGLEVAVPDESRFHRRLCPTNRPVSLTDLRILDHIGSFALPNGSTDWRR
jgi:hypothetical protein